MTVEFKEDHKSVTKLKKIWSRALFGILSDLKQRCLSVRKGLLVKVTPTPWETGTHRISIIVKELPQCIRQHCRIFPGVEEVTRFKNGKGIERKESIVQATKYDHDVHNYIHCHDVIKNYILPSTLTAMPLNIVLIHSSSFLT